jgi:undecaprenyl-diphosphatase
MPYFWLFSISLMIGLTTIFADLAEDVWFKEGFAWDAAVALAIHQFSRPWLDVVMKVITQTGNLGAVGLVIGLALWFYWRRQPRKAILLVTTFGGAVVLNTLLKLVFARPRPLIFPPLVLETDYSFPSGHAVAAISLYGLLAVLLGRQRHYGWALLAGVWVLAVAVSRVYLGVHYPSDVLASLAIGGLWLFGAFFVFDWVEGRIQSDLQTSKDQ